MCSSLGNYTIPLQKLSAPETIDKAHILLRNVQYQTSGP